MVDNAEFGFNSEPICNPRLPTNIKKGTKGMWVHCNGGKIYI